MTHLRDALAEVIESGSRLGSYWRREKIDDEELAQRREHDKGVCAAFVEISAKIAGHRLRAR